jgi:excisionase family DNA binding protein
MAKANPHAGGWPPLLYTVAEAARMCGLSRATLWKAIADYRNGKPGGLRAIKLRGRTLILRKDLEDWVNAARGP